MNISSFSFLLHKPSKVSGEHANELQKVIEEFPYFQPARALQLKALKQEKSIRYNNALKVVAAHTKDRSILFEFITSPTFIQDQVANRITQMAPGMDIAELEVEDLEEVIVKDSKTSFDFDQVDAEAVMDPELFSPRTPEKESPSTETERDAVDLKPEATPNTEIPKGQPQAEAIPNTETPEPPTQAEAAPDTATPKAETTPERRLELGKPLDFDRSETHSFSEWLQLSSKFKPIERSEEPEKTAPSQAAKAPEDKASEKRKFPKAKSLSEEDDKGKPSEPAVGLKNKLDLIDRFIETNPKISPVKKEVPPTLTVRDNTPPPHQLMTETLARVYLEQKKYKKAIQAYKILSLKYPEKSALFADQIKAIKNLKDSNK